jgi:O-antigen ligase
MATGSATRMRKQRPFDPAAGHARRARWAWILLLAASLPWERGVGVGAAGSSSQLLTVTKLGVLLVAVWLAYGSRRPGPRPFALWALAGYAAVSGVGALLNSVSVDGAFRSVRMILMLVAAHWVTTRLRPTELVRALVGLSVVIVAAAVAGEVTGRGLTAGDRLGGWLPPLHPNWLGSVAAVALACVVAMTFTRELRSSYAAVLGALLLYALVRSGSRTALLALAAALIVIGLRSLWLKDVLRALTVMWAAAIAVGVLLWIEWNSRLHPLAGVWESLTTRGGAATVDPTLTGRTYAWEIAWNSLHGWAAELFGLGLQQKTVLRPIGASFSAQGIDNSWLSAYVAGGWLGAALLVAGMAALLVRAVRSRDIAAQGLVFAALAASWTESVLADVTYALIAATVVCIAATRTDPEPRPTS